MVFSLINVIEVSLLYVLTRPTRAGVYVGCMYHEWLNELTTHGMELTPRSVIGSGPAYMVGRLSYMFGLQGPCVSTDTACSSSLIATHLAHNGESLRICCALGVTQVH